MATIAIVNALKQSFCKVQPVSVLNRQFSSTITVLNQQSSQETISSNTQQQVNENVPGLSEACVTSDGPVGPGAAKDAEYKVPEYFNFNQYSYFEAEIEMNKYRCPQPSAVNK